LEDICKAILLLIFDVDIGYFRTKRFSKNIGGKAKNTCYMSPGRHNVFTSGDYFRIHGQAASIGLDKSYYAFYIDM